jgi:hypothetical protein
LKVNRSLLCQVTFKSHHNDWLLNLIFNLQFYNRFAYLRHVEKSFLICHIVANYERVLIGKHIVPNESMAYISDVQVYLSVSSSIIVKHKHNLVVGVNYSLAVFFKVNVFVHKSSN